MKFLVEHFSNDTVCSVKICFKRTPAENCYKREQCSFQWFISGSTTYLGNNRLTNNTPTVNNTSGLEPCIPNTWLWVVDNSQEGEAHFVVGNNIMSNVSEIH